MRTTPWQKSLTRTGARSSSRGGGGFVDPDDNGTAGEVIERVLRESVNNEEIGEKLFDDACGVQRLPNGNTVVTSYHAKGDSVKLFEVTRDKKVVWRYSGMKAGFHHFQILTTNGKPLAYNTWK